MSTNNTAEYEGFLAGLRIAVDLMVKKLIIRVMHSLSSDMLTRIIRVH